MIATRRRVRPVLFLLAGLALVALSRLPQLLSPWLGLDGDEAVVALMAQHIRDGKELPLFFWGQNYGLTLPEAATIAAFFAIFGPSVIALKIAILVIWTGGCAALVQSVRVLGGHRAGLIAAALIIFCPAWFAWSLKAR
ncbi:MAG TPA: hypothetical protein VKU85_14545, partial [bacterium]|nr:hypothetical protein [bacterium]